MEVTMKKVISIILIILCITIAPAPVYAAVPSYNLSSIKKITITENKTAKLTLPTKYKNIAWKSSNTKVASISKKGTLTANASGTSTIIATSGKTKFSCKVYVNEDYSEWILYSTDNLRLLAENIIDGYVVYMNDRYYCSPEYFKMMEDTQIVYEHDVSEDDDSTRDIILTPDAKFIFAEDDEEEEAAKEEATRINMALMMKYGFASSEDLDTEIGKAYVKFCDTWISEYELENSYGISTVWSWPNNSLYLIIDTENNYIIEAIPDKFVNGTIYTNGEVQYQYLEKFVYKGESYTENQYYFNRKDLINKGIIKE
jgi:hypothetical protein